jgi:RNA polymerase sigma factor (sigma-70 family)
MLDRMETRSAAHDARAALEASWHIESAKLVAVLTRLVRDVNLAEEFAHDTFLAALYQWPRDGVPANPGAWLVATAKNRAIDHLRRERGRAEAADRSTPAMVARADFDLAGGDAPDSDDVRAEDTLRVIFLACHPVLSREARAALALKLLCGLSTPEVARAFLVPEATIAQRIVRAQRTLAEKNATFEDLTRDERHRRLPSVLEVVYLLFNEGYAATAGEDWMRPALCEEAVRLGRVLAELQPDEAEVHGLVALMEIQASRAGARVDATGRPVLLLDQNRARWDRLLIRRGLAALERALAQGDGRGFYTLQACIAACHARAKSGAETDWRRMVGHYDELLRVVDSPVVELNRAVAVGMADGPAAALALVDALAAERVLADYHLLPSVRGDLLHKLGRTAEARAEFERAAGMTDNAREAELLRERARG